MKQRDKNKLKMYKTVEAICTAQQADWTGMPAFSTLFSSFTVKVHELEQASFKQGSLTAGVTPARDQLVRATIAKAEVVANALRAFAAGTNNALLTGQLSFPKSDFLHNGYQHVLELTDRILLHANDHIAALSDYGIVQNDVDQLTGLRTQLGDVLGSPRMAIVERKSETEKIRELIGEIDDLLKGHLDRLVEVLKPGHGDFYKLFRGARVIVDSKGKTHGDDAPEGMR